MVVGGTPKNTRSGRLICQASTFLNGFHLLRTERKMQPAADEPASLAVGLQSQYTPRARQTAPVSPCGKSYHQSRRHRQFLVHHEAKAGDGNVPEKSVAELEAWLR
jgi:hypothetical protein